MPVGKVSAEQEGEQSSPRPLGAEKPEVQKSLQQRQNKLIPPQLCFSFGRPVYLSTTTWFLRRMEGGSKLPGLQGIGNAGNTCYMNAALQALAHCPPFMLYCLDCEMFIRHLSGQGVATVFCSLMKRLWSTERYDDFINPRPLARVMNNPMFMGVQQQDSQEFLRCLLDIMHEELKVEVPSRPSEAPSRASGSVKDADCSSNGNSNSATAASAAAAPEPESSSPPQKQPSHRYALRSRGECSSNEPVGGSPKNRQPAASHADNTTANDAGGDMQVDEVSAVKASAEKLQMFLLRTAIVSDHQVPKPRHQRLPEREPFTAYELDLDDWSTHRVRPVHCPHGTCLLCSAKARYFRRSAPHLIMGAKDNESGTAVTPPPDDELKQQQQEELNSPTAGKEEPMDTTEQAELTEESIAPLQQQQRRPSLSRQNRVTSTGSSASTAPDLQVSTASPIVQNGVHTSSAATGPGDSEPADSANATLSIGESNGRGSANTALSIGGCSGGGSTNTALSIGECNGEDSTNTALSIGEDPTNTALSTSECNGEGDVQNPALQHSPCDSPAQEPSSNAMEEKHDPGSSTSPSSSVQNGEHQQQEAGSPSRHHDQQAEAEQTPQLDNDEAVNAHGEPSDSRPTSVLSDSKFPPGLKAMIQEAASDESSDEEDSTSEHSSGRSSTPSEPAKVYRSIVTDIFGGVTQSSVSCNACDQSSKQCEPFLDLSISLPDAEQVQALIKARDASKPPTLAEQPRTGEDGESNVEKEPGGELSNKPLQPGDKPSLASRVWSVVKSALTSRHLTLTECMDIYFSQEELTGANQYHCEKCNAKVDGARKVSLKKLPEIMCIHLKRFRHELQSSSKIGEPVSFPMQSLDLRRFLSDDAEEEVSTYDLIAVVSHIGGVAGGHYVTFVRHFLSSNWYELDDLNVHPVTEQYVAGVEAYMLFYKKSSPEMSTERANVMRQVAKAECEPGQEMCFVSRQWVHRFNTCFDPGPITNKDFICEHGGAGIHTAQEILQMVTFAPRPLWDSLVDRYGGGPLATTLRVCMDCRQSYDALLRRRHLEYQKFALLNQPMQEDGQIIFLVDRNWFLQWRDCVRSDDPDVRVPGPLDNTRLLAQLRRYGTNLPKGLFPLELTWDAFFFLFSLYGGGPVIYAIG